MGHDFEHLSRALMDVIHKVKNENDLLKLSCALLKAKAAVLVEYPLTQAQNCKIFSVYPSSVSGWGTDLHRQLWDWIKEAHVLESPEGVILETPLVLENKTFPGGLIAFGTPDLDKKGWKLALVVLQAVKIPKFLSYHSWACYNLLKQYEFVLTQSKRKNENRHKQIYLSFAGNFVFPDESWKDLNDRVNASAQKVSIHGIWICFQLFKFINKKEMDGQLSGIKTAYDLYKTVIGKPSNAIEKAINILLSPDKKRLFEMDPARAAAFGTELFKDSVDRDNPEKTWFACLFLSFAWWYLMQQAFLQDGDCRAEKQASENQEASSDDIQIIRKALYVEKDADLTAVSLDIPILMRLTRQTLRSFLESDLFSCPETGLANWGREALRLYLALEITNGNSCLSQLYLDGERILEHRFAPERLRRHFIVNLARFMISAMGICLNKLNLTLEPDLRLISPSEELDSLLYMVDRYVHVEIGVEKKLNIREKLGRQIAAEVHLHLSAPHYRDHLLHVIDVFLLGHLILNTRISWIGKARVPMIDHLCKIGSSRKDDDTALSLREEWLRNWAVASLLHDIGYQIGHKERVSKDEEVWQKYFALDTTDGPGNLHLGPKSIPANGLFQKSHKEMDFLKNLYQEITGVSTVCKAMLPSLDDSLTDHGVLSALRVSQVLVHADNHHATKENKLSSSLIEKYQHAIHAISFHNLHSVKITLEKNPLACLLRLCDELQEWDRRRVNIEKVIKGLYLDIQEGLHQSIGGHDLLNTFCANIKIAPQDNNGDAFVLFATPESGSPRLHFQLRYKDAVSAGFDPTMTLLDKSYCFQNLDLSVDHQKQNEIRIMVEMQFPIPNAYNGISEYDIYGMFTEEARDLPLLEKEQDIGTSQAGLVKLETKDDANGVPHECFGIVLQQKSEIRLGWIPAHPGFYRERFAAFKNKMLPHMNRP